MTSSEIECVEDLLVHALHLRNFHAVDCMLKHCEVSQCDNNLLMMMLKRTEKYSQLLHYRDKFVLEVERKLNLR